MNEFIEKWNTDPRFKTKTKLGLYTLFVVIVAIFAFSTRNTIPTNTLEIINKNKTDDISIEIPEKYSYVINIGINEKKYKYNGNKDSDMEIIDKTYDDITNKYIYQDGRYYKDATVISNIITKEEVYDIIDYNYLNIDTINKYLSVSEEEDGTYLVYLKDIILGNDSEEYITITMDENKTSINYTSLMKLFDKTIENCVVEVIIEEKE